MVHKFTSSQVHNQPSTQAQCMRESFYCIQEHSTACASHSIVYMSHSIVYRSHSTECALLQEDGIVSHASHEAEGALEVRPLPAVGAAQGIRVAIMIVA